MKAKSITILFFSLVISVVQAQDKILVAAASDLKFAMDSVISVFNKANAGKVDVTYGSSGKLSEQIINGAPYDIFFSADISYPEKLRLEKKSGSEIYQYSKGRLVLWSRSLDVTKKEMQILVDPKVSKIAIANPLHAPYGKRAVESMTYYKSYEKVKSKLVYGENISQTAQFVSTGAADVGLIALSLALSPNMKDGKYFLIPEESHAALIQAAVITQTGKNKKLAAAFFAFVKSDAAVAILKKYGFTRP